MYPTVPLRQEASSPARTTGERNKFFTVLARGCRVRLITGGLLRAYIPPRREDPIERHSACDG